MILRRHVVCFVDRNVARIHREESANINVQQPVCILGFRCDFCSYDPLQ